MNLKIKKMVVPGIILILILLLYLFDKLNTNAYILTELSVRVERLNSWHYGLCDYIKKNKLPDNLYDYCKQVNDIPCSKVRLGDHSRYDVEPLLNNPALFHEEIEYELFKSTSGWIIKETRGGTFYKDILMIDQQGQIYMAKKRTKQSLILK